MTYYQVESPFPRPLLYYDAQKLYCLLYGDGKTKLSLDQAVADQGLESDEPFHQALDDARYTGRILARMDFQKVRPYVSVDYYRPFGFQGGGSIFKIPRLHQICVHYIP